MMMYPSIVYVCLLRCCFRHKRIELSQWRRRFSQSQADSARSLPQHIQAAMTSLPMHYLNGASQDLKRFLEEVQQYYYIYDI